MNTLTVVERELKQEYKFKDKMWRCVYQKAFSIYASRVYRHNALVLFPLLMDIRLGMMKYYYFGQGLGYVKKCIDTYYETLIKRMTGQEVIVDTDCFFVKTLLTTQQQIEDQLQKELNGHLNDYG